MPTEEQKVEQQETTDQQERKPSRRLSRLLDRSRKEGSVENGQGLLAQLRGAPPRPRSDLEGEAAAELEQSVAPAMEALLQAAPGAKTPEDAAEFLKPSPMGEGIVVYDRGDRGFHSPEAAETLVYYRLRHHLARRDYPSDFERTLTAMTWREQADGAPINAGQPIVPSLPRKKR